MKILRLILPRYVWNRTFFPRPQHIFTVCFFLLNNAKEPACTMQAGSVHFLSTDAESGLSADSR